MFHYTCSYRVVTTSVCNFVLAQLRDLFEACRFMRCFAHWILRLKTWIPASHQSSVSSKPSGTDCNSVGVLYMWKFPHVTWAKLALYYMLSNLTINAVLGVLIVFIKNFMRLRANKKPLVSEFHLCGAPAHPVNITPTWKWFSFVLSMHLLD